MNEKHTSLSTPQDVARRGEHIYSEKFKAEFEEKYRGQFAAVDVISGRAFVAPFADEVLSQARKAEPAGIFHLIKIGFSGAFRVSSCVAKIRNGWALQSGW